MYFWLSIHHEWTIGDYWLIEGLSCHNENLCNTRRYHIYFASRLRKIYHISILEIFFSYSDFSFYHEHHRREIFWNTENYIPSSFESDIVELHRRKGLRCSYLLVFHPHFILKYKISCNHSDCSTRENDLRNHLSREGLILRRSHLMSLWEIHPELRHVLDSARTRKWFGHEFIMEESTSRRHPLYLIGADHTTVPRSILMLDLAIIDDRHRFESSMWMKSYSWTMSACLWKYLPRCIIIEHEKWTRIIRHFSSISWDILWYTESITHHMMISGVFESSNCFLHIFLIKSIPTSYEKYR